MQISNINYDAILPSYKSLENENKQIYDKVNNDMLIMLSAYDESNIKEPELLIVVKKIAKWILHHDKSSFLSNKNT